MANESIEVRAPQGAVAWTPTDGWLYDSRDLPDHVEDGHYVLVVSESDGKVRGVTAHTTAPLAAVLRLETDVAELVARVADIDPGDDQAIEAVSDLRMAMVDFFEFASARLSQRRELMWGDRPPNDG